MLTAVLPPWHVGVHTCMQMSACSMGTHEHLFLKCKEINSITFLHPWGMKPTEKEESAEGFIRPYNLMSYGKTPLR